MLSPHVQEIVVAGVREERGPKSDKIDAFGLAEKLRVGAVERRVYKEQGTFGALRELCRAYNVLAADSIRVQNRIKSLFRSRGIPSSTRRVCSAGRRKEWIEELPARSQPLAETLYLEYDAPEELRERAEEAMLDEARKHAMYRILKTVPGMRYGHKRRGGKAKRGDKRDGREADHSQPVPHPSASCANILPRNVPFSSRPSPAFPVLPRIPPAYSLRRTTAGSP